MEGQFRNYFEAAEREPGVTGLNLLRHLELRLDNVVYRMGLGSSRKQARQLVGHRHFEVNGRVVNVPSFQVRPGDVAKVPERSPTASAVFDVARGASGSRTMASWLSFDEGE